MNATKHISSRHTKRTILPVLLATALATLMVTGCSNGESHAAQLVTDMVKASSGQNARVIGVDSSSVEGLYGVVFEANGQRLFAWVPKGSDTVLIGAAYAPDGSNLTRQTMAKYGLVDSLKNLELGAGGNTTNNGPRIVRRAPTSAPAPANASRAAIRDVVQQGGIRTNEFLHAAQQATGFTEGSAGPLINIFFDPNCAHCHVQYQKLKPYLNGGLVRVHWIPVGVLTETSMARASSLLRAQDPVQALAQSMADPNVGIEGVDAQTRLHLEANNALLDLGTQGKRSTPYLVYQRAAGDVAIKPYRVDDVEALIADAARN